MLSKKWAFALGVLSLSTACVMADQEEGLNDNQSSSSKRVGELPSGVITPAVGPMVNLAPSSRPSVFTTADFIYWKAQQDGLEYAVNGVIGFEAPNADTGVFYSVEPDHGKVKVAGRPWEPGFKLGIGLEFQHDGWDLFTQWTWLNPTTHNKNVSNLGSSEYALNSAIPSRTGLLFQKVGNCDKVSGAWTLHYNVMDLELGRNFFLSRYMTLRPHVGLKTAWVNQKFNTAFSLSPDAELVFLVDSLQYSGGALQSRQSQESWGLGIRAGLDPVWRFSRNWGLYGNIAASAMYQYYSDTLEMKLQNTTFQYEGQGLGGLRSFDVINANRSQHVVTPVLELGLGIEYMTWFCDQAYMVELKAGWEEQIWFNTNRFLDAFSTGNLTLEGFTLKAGFHF
ncbi:MAG: Lpg1974 family pore-forming outer membrane protein [Chlamydiae bacterium]|nr:Lpg1974 family pore-forming outer membrane protein [Chlamydiota bacterium]